MGSLLFNSEDLIDTYELSSEDLEKKREEERIIREEIERYQKAAGAAILLYQNIIKTYNEENFNYEIISIQLKT